MKKNLKYEVLDKEYVVNDDGKVEALVQTIMLRKHDNKGDVIVEHKARIVEYWTNTTIVGR